MIRLDYPEPRLSPAKLEAYWLMGLVLQHSKIKPRQIFDRVSEVAYLPPDGKTIREWCILKGGVVVAEQMRNCGISNGRDLCKLIVERPRRINIKNAKFNLIRGRTTGLGVAGAAAFCTFTQANFDGVVAVPSIGAWIRKHHPHVDKLPRPEAGYAQWLAAYRDCAARAFPDDGPARAHAKIWGVRFK